MSKLKTLKNLKLEKLIPEEEYQVQNQLMSQLDQYSQSNRDFNQNIINEIVLFKVNRYAKLESEHLELLNEINSNDMKLDENLTTSILKELLQLKGIGLPMASTILRFKNPNIYQIIDQRVYRIMYGHTFASNASKTEKKIEEKIKIYIKYLIDLKNECKKYKINFFHSDRILYDLDKVHNKNIKINY
tara:strand:+ start:391 stop:954 length:564 start_codon:yes stop_codon:yes gene_type:complete